MLQMQIVHPLHHYKYRHYYYYHYLKDTKVSDTTAKTVPGHFIWEMCQRYFRMPKHTAKSTQGQLVEAWFVQECLQILSGGRQCDRVWTGTSRLFHMHKCWITIATSPASNTVQYLGTAFSITLGNWQVSFPL